MHQMLDIFVLLILGYHPRKENKQFFIKTVLRVSLIHRRLTMNKRQKKKQAMRRMSEGFTNALETGFTGNFEVDISGIMVEPRYEI